MSLRPTVTASSDRVSAAGATVIARAPHLHLGHPRERRRHPFDDEPARGVDLLVTLPLDVGHPARRLHVGRHDAASAIESPSG